MVFTNAVIVVLEIAIGLIAPARSAPTPLRQEAETSGYAWAGACKECHEEIFVAWDKTKHARALNRLSAAEQERECVGCHVTGATARVTVNGQIANAGVQCESCHGPGRLHAKDPWVSGTIGRTPAESTCRGCHNEKSPRFKGFVYSAMARLSHPLGK